MHRRTSGEDVRVNEQQSYQAGRLQPGERVLAVGRLHWIIYCNAVIALALSALLLWFGFRGERTVGTTVMTATGLLVLVAAAGLAVVALLRQRTTEIAVTSMRMLYQRGILSRLVGEMSLEKIESVTVSQTILGRAENYGTLVVHGAGQDIELHNIRAPNELRNSMTAA